MKFSDDDKDKDLQFKGALLALALILLTNFALLVLTIWAAIHFVRKFW